MGNSSKWYPLNGKDIEFLDSHPYLSKMTADFPEVVREEVRDFFARGLRAGIAFGPTLPLDYSFIPIQEILPRNKPSEN